MGTSSAVNRFRFKIFFRQFGKKEVPRSEAGVQSEGFNPFQMAVCRGDRPVVGSFVTIATREGIIVRSVQRFRVLSAASSGTLAEFVHRGGSGRKVWQLGSILQLTSELRSNSREVGITVLLPHVLSSREELVPVTPVMFRFRGASSQLVR